MTSTNDFTIDLEHLGQPAYVAAQVMITTEGPILLDTGPGSTMATLHRGLDRAGIQVSDLRAILLSHIHFDHAGATGLLVEQNPGLEVYVHERGAVHLVDPTKLVASATRVFGADFDRLWGRFLAVPADRVRALRGGETITIGNRGFEVAYTPGHAVHHVSYYEAADRTAYVGDCGGIRPPTLPVALPVTPPPDFDLEAWLTTLDTIEAWQPRRLFCTHFGFSDDPAFHLAELRAGLRDWVEITRQLLERDTTDGERAAAFERFVVDSLQGKATPEAIRARAEFSDYQASWYGIARYWRKRLPPPPS
jgi:glyoxylase-like metal-dependent hydrolase (beta-lactamase superfamily II)